MENWGLHQRQRRLLYLLNCKHGIETGKALAQKLGVSERTVRNDIADINWKLESAKIEIETVHGKGYSLQIGNRDVFHSLFSERDNIQTREDRLLFLLLKLIRSDDWVDIQTLEEDIFVSRTTVEKDIREIKRQVTENEPCLLMERQGNKIRFERDEIKKRHILIHIYYEMWDYNSRDGIAPKEKLISRELLSQIRSDVKKALREQKMELDDFGQVYLTVSLAVLYSRVIEGYNLSEESVNTWLEDKTPPLPRVHIATDAVLNWLNRSWELTLEPAEYRWLSIILSHLLLFNLKKHTIEEVREETETVCSDAAGMIIREIRKIYALDLEDESFYVDMALHTQALVNSMISTQHQSQYLTEELRAENPFLGEIAGYIRERLEALCGLHINHEEENYFLPFIASAQERRLERLCKEGISIAVVSHLNAGLTYYLMHRIRKLFGNRVHLLGPFPIYDRDKIDEVDARVIVTTVRMDVFRQFDMPVVTVSPSVLEEERKALEKQIIKQEQRYLYPYIPEAEKLLNDFYNTRIERRIDLKELLEEAEEHLRGKMVFNEDAKVDWKCVRYSYIKEDKLLAMPKVSGISESVLSVCECKYKMNWETYKIRRVIVLFLKAEDRRLLGSIYQILPEL